MSKKFDPLPQHPVHSWQCPGRRYGNLGFKDWRRYHDVALVPALAQSFGFLDITLVDRLSDPGLVRLMSRLMYPWKETLDLVIRDTGAGTKKDRESLPPFLCLHPLLQCQVCNTRRTIHLAESKLDSGNEHPAPMPLVEFLDNAICGHLCLFAAVRYLGRGWIEVKGCRRCDQQETTARSVFLHSAAMEEAVTPRPSDEAPGHPRIFRVRKYIESLKGQMITYTIRWNHADYGAVVTGTGPFMLDGTVTVFPVRELPSPLLPAATGGSDDAGQSDDPLSQEQVDLFKWSDWSHLPTVEPPSMFTCRYMDDAGCALPDGSAECWLAGAQRDLYEPQVTDRGPGTFKRTITPPLPPRVKNPKPKSLRVPQVQVIPHEPTAFECMCPACVPPGWHL